MVVFALKSGATEPRRMRGCSWVVARPRYMKGAALARAARGWHADARDRALGADLKNEDIVYLFRELTTIQLLEARVRYHKTSNRVYVILFARSRLQFWRLEASPRTFRLAQQPSSCPKQIGLVNPTTLELWNWFYVQSTSVFRSYRTWCAETLLSSGTLGSGIVPHKHQGGTRKR